MGKYHCALMPFQFTSQPFTLFHILLWTYRELQWSIGAKQTLSLDNVTWHFHGLKHACMESVTYKNMQSVNVQHKLVVLPFVCVCFGEIGQSFEDTDACLIRDCFLGSYVKSCQNSLLFYLGSCTVWTVWKRGEPTQRTLVLLQLIHYISFIKIALSLEKIKVGK